MLPFSYPTTTIIIDDEPNFINTLRNTLDDGILCRCFSDTQEALNFIEEQSHSTVKIENFFTALQNVHDLDVQDLGDLFLKVKSNYWFPILQSPERFQEISIAVIDYSMPKINGLELCRQIKHLPMKKIMLTGQASKDLAVQAFNEKIIDSFIVKDGDAAENLHEQITALTKNYFLERTQALKLAFSLQETRFISNPAFEELFLKISRKQGVSEYFVNTQPPGILMFEESGAPHMLLVYDQERLRAHLEIASEAGAPEEFLVALSRQQILPLFPTATGYYDPFYAKDWKDYVYPAQVLEGESPLFVSSMSNASFVLEHLNNYISLEKYKSALDPEEVI